MPPPPKPLSRHTMDRMRTDGFTDAEVLSAIADPGPGEVVLPARTIAFDGVLSLPSGRTLRGGAE